jgi:leader peptidase (prepilin peptidase)/N-methyltransferase
MDWDFEIFRHHGPFGLPFHFWTFFAFLFGTTAGSFLNVVIHRMPRGESVVRPPSHCPKCGQRIHLLQNLPILSWLLLRGRCAGCRQPISPRYIAVEALTGFLFVAAWIHYGEVSPGAAIAASVLLAGFVAATFIDFEHFIIPDEITLGGIGAGFLLSLAGPELHRVSTLAEAMRSSGLGIAVGGGVVYLVLRMGKLLFGRERIEIAPGTRLVFHENGVRLPDREMPFEEIFYRESDTIVVEGLRVELSDRCYPAAEIRLSPKKLLVGGDEMDPEGEPYLSAAADSLSLPREAMGLGDVKFMAAIGAFLGWKATLFSLMFSSVLGAVVGVGLIAVGRQHWSGRLPYGPYIAVAATAWVFGASALWDRLFGG